MKKILGSQNISASEYFKTFMRQEGYTAESFVQTYNSVYPDSPISVSTVRSWSTGRRSFARTAALTVQRVAHILDDPDSGDTDYTRYAGIMYHLINGSSILLYE